MAPKSQELHWLRLCSRRALQVLRTTCVKQGEQAQRMKSRLCTAAGNLSQCLSGILAYFFAARHRQS